MLRPTSFLRALPPLRPLQAPLSHPRPILAIRPRFVTTEATPAASESAPAAAPESTPTAAAPASTEATPAEPTAAAAATAPEFAPPAASAPSLHYALGRTASGHFAVYNDRKAGGSKKLTRIKKIEGDTKQLAGELRDALGVEARINPVTRHVEVEGHLATQINKYLNERGL